MSDNKMDLSRVEAKLDVLINLMALSVAPEELSLKERAVRLHRTGLAPKEIAELCGTPRNTVSVALTSAKRKTKGKKANG